MRHLKVNLLSQANHSSDQVLTPRRRVKFFLPMTALVVFLASFVYGRMTLSEGAASPFAALDDLPIFSQMRHLIGSPDRKLQGEADDRINILLLGMGGEGHEGPFLTDTIMIASIKPSENRVALLSIPRDLLVPMPTYGWKKVNSINAYGEAKTPGRGGEFSRTVLEGLLGIDIPYYVRIDFSGFKQLIDDVDGLDINVERTFTDYTYPTNNFKTQIISFEKGWQHMNGEDSLRFSRSRHGNNNEGSDFARAARQQKIMSALKDKLLSVDTLKNPARINATLATLRANISTNLQIGEILRLAKMGKTIGRERISQKIIDDSPGSPLVSSTVGGAYVLLPRHDDWAGIRSVAADLFALAPVPQAAADSASGTTVADKPAPREPAKVAILNGTSTSGLARTVSEKLSSAGFKIVKIGNAGVSASSTVVHDLTKGAKNGEIQRLLSTLPDAKALNSAPPETGEGTDADFVIVLGSN